MNLTFSNHTLPIGEIRITKEFSDHMPHLDKFKKCMDFYRNNGRFDRQIIVDSENYLHDGYCAYITAVLLGVEKVKVLMVGEKPEAVIPATEPVKENEPIKLYCVKNFGAGEWITKGKIYELDAAGRIHFDDGYVRDFQSIPDGASVKCNLFPLVRRPAKVGEWVIATSADGHRAKLNVPYEVLRMGKNIPDWVYVAVDCGDTCIRDSQYLVLDGYTGDPA